MGDKKKIMIIGAGVLQVPAIVKAKEMGLEVIALDMDANAPGFEIADKSYRVSTIDIDAALKIAKNVKPDAVMTLASDMPMRTVSAIGRELGLNTISEESAVNATDKASMRQVLEKYNVPIPKFYIVDKYDQFTEVIKNFDNNFIVKPADNSGSRGVTLADKNSDYRQVFEYSKKHSRSGQILIEEYMNGPEVSVESITINGETKFSSITDKVTSGAPNFVEKGHSTPSNLKRDIQDKIIEVTKKAIKAIGIETGPSHTEIIITNEGPKVVEIGARLGGDNITTHLVPLSTGINMVESCIKIALEMNVDLTINKAKGSAIKYFEVESGVLSKISDLEEVNKIQGVKEIVFTKKISDIISKVQSSSDRIGYVISVGDAVDDAIKICEEVQDKLKIEII